ncbi:hypothetical protein PQR63_08495 [Herbaspirillum rhizosphaerae]|uniref:Uncharacterized protein n=2 Tax=Herbaspirillum TaxID=963 RepID=A0ABW8Z696_9BURK
MDAINLWAALRSLHPERTERLVEAVGPVFGTAESFIEHLDTLRQGAAIANGRCGYIGNPYEQIAEDFEVLVCVAKRDFG